MIVGRKSKLNSWIDSRRAKGHDGSPILYVNPADNWLVGSAAICRYLRIKDSRTLANWVELYGLPAIKLPVGAWVCSMTAIDQWLFISSEMDTRRREKIGATHHQRRRQRERRDRRIARADAEAKDHCEATDTASMDGRGTKEPTEAL